MESREQHENSIRLQIFKSAGACPDENSNFSTTLGLDLTDQCEHDFKPKRRSTQSGSYDNPTFVMDEVVGQKIPPVNTRFATVRKIVSRTNFYTNNSSNAKKGPSDTKRAPRFINFRNYFATIFVRLVDFLRVSFASVQITIGGMIHVAQMTASMIVIMCMSLVSVDTPGAVFVNITAICSLMMSLSEVFFAILQPDAKSESNPHVGIAIDVGISFLWVVMWFSSFVTCCMWANSPQHPVQDRINYGAPAFLIFVATGLWSYRFYRVLLEFRECPEIPQPVDRRSLPVRTTKSNMSLSSTTSTATRFSWKQVSETLNQKDGPSSTKTVLVICLLFCVGMLLITTGIILLLNHPNKYKTKFQNHGIRFLVTGVTFWVICLVAQKKNFLKNIDRLEHELLN